MPPKKLPSKLTAQGSSSLNPPPTARSYRQPVPTPDLPESDSIPPLWTPNAVPTEVFPEWTDPSTLPSGHWGTAEEPFEDQLSPENLLVPTEAIGYKEEITWKRPCEFLPVIADLPVVPATPPPAVPEPKAAGGKKGAAPTAKKGEPEPPKKPPPSKHAHVFLPRSKERDYGFLRSEKAGASASGTVTAPSTASDLHHDQEWRIPRDFQRRWSPEQIDALQAWGREEERIEREQQNRERVYMGFEDAIAYIVNERPRDLLAEVDFDADDLVDDGEDEDEAITGDVDVSNATSPWGVVPPPRIEVAPNSVYKPEIPHGEIVHADMASYFRIVEQLYTSGDESIGVFPNPAPFLWQAIYPQDSSGHPVYNAGGKYSVKLFVCGRWRRVDVDDRLPLDSDGNVVYLASSMKNEVWPSLLVKALYKVMYWLHPNYNQSAEPDARSISLVDGMCQRMVQIMLTLTSWKVSRWEPGISQSFSENIYHQLQQFVPRTQQPEQIDEPSELSLEADSAADGTAEIPPVVEEMDDKPATQSSPKPRAVICSAGRDRVADLVFGEAVLVTDVVGDTGNTTFKVVHQGSPAAISEEVTGVNDLVFLLVHPLLQYSDTFVRAWLPNPESSLEGAPLAPFETPRVHFVVVTLQDRVAEQPAGDNSTEISHKYVNLVATLTPVQVPYNPDQSVDNLSKPSALTATYLGVDPNGSVILIEEKEKKENSRSSLPVIVTLNSTFSGYINIPAVDTGSIVYRMYPQNTLRYGYSMQVESDYKVAFQDAPTYWRSLSNLRVMECDGTYPVMLPGSWNVIFKQSFELSPLTEENVSPPELRIDLHLTEELLGSFTHISVVNDFTGEVKRAATLCSKISLPAASNDGVFTPTTYTLIVDCAPGDFHVRQGKWKLTLASDWDITKPTTHQMKMTRYEGVYEPNKPLLCFRDVIMAPKNSIWTSFQLQLLQDGAVVNNLAAKLEVFDLGTEQNPKIGEVSAKGDVRLLQLPCIPAGEVSQPPVDDKRGYILQGSIDRSTCIVPDELNSLRPFRSSTGRTPVTTTPVDENESSEAAASGESNLPATARSSRGSSGIKWRVNCWSTEEVKLLEDNTKELQYEAIRASWAEKAVDRTTNGAVSRLLYLGKLDQAEAKMKQDNMTDEQIAKVRGRFEWVQAVKSKVAAPEGISESYLEQVGTGDEKLLSEDELAESRHLLLERIGVVEADKEQRRVARALAKEERAKELKNMVRTVIEKRAVSLKTQQELKRELAAVQTRSA
ncbi:hypothetical protein PR003_g1337 [Phytophthora rubi]|uniref:Calpain catalytic domain-containing protein n=1 Tax=Phytophthora rubi TaxID=129364 RepID=A0A6A4G5Q9_9STRA|nr:hypothetical protein PR003_g1337 [Phytophthora rubi]